MSDNRIDGFELTELRIIADQRGAVLHMIRADAPQFTKFGELYFSEVLPGSVKAWKRHTRQTQTFAVPAGRIQIVIYDDRPGSGTRGTLQVLELGRPDRYCLLRIPPGLWYGFACLSATPALIANCADLPHDPTESELRPVDDASIPYDWRTKN
jgi:dTDP-4-dehydrorhamnose 3,5-epimerase